MNYAHKDTQNIPNTHYLEYFFNYIDRALAIPTSHLDIAHARRPLALMARMITPSGPNDHSRLRAAITSPPTTRKVHTNPLRQPRDTHPCNLPVHRQNPRKNASQRPKISGRSNSTPPPEPRNLTNLTSNVTPPVQKVASV